MTMKTPDDGTGHCPTCGQPVTLPKEAADAVYHPTGIKRYLADVKRAIERQSVTTRVHLAGRFVVD